MTKQIQEGDEESILERIYKDPEVETKEALAQEIAEKFTFGALEVLEALEEEIRHAELAARFNRTTTVQDISLRTALPLSPLVQTAVEEEGEAGYKREQLLRYVATIRTRLRLLAGDLRDIIMDFESSKIDD